MSEFFLSFITLTFTDQITKESILWCILWRKPHPRNKNKSFFSVGSVNINFLWTWRLASYYLESRLKSSQCLRKFIKVIRKCNIALAISLCLEIGYQIRFWLATLNYLCGWLEEPSWSVSKQKKYTKKIGYHHSQMFRG